MQSAADDDETPLFATSVPAAGLNPAMQAIAALIDEDETPAPSGSGGRKRKAASLGTAQVHLALATCESGRPEPPPATAASTSAAVETSSKRAKAEDGAVAEPTYTVLCVESDEERDVDDEAMEPAHQRTDVDTYPDTYPTVGRYPDVD